MRHKWIGALLHATVVLVLASEGLMLLEPDGALVHAAQPRAYRRKDEAISWWRQSPVHLGCSIPSCTRPATRTASYRILGLRGSTWRAYGFCDQHQPPAQMDALVYRQGHPPPFSYDIPLSPILTEIYFLLGAFGFAVWCAYMWHWARPDARIQRWISFALLHAGVLVGLWLS